MGLYRYNVNRWEKLSGTGADPVAGPVGSTAPPSVALSSFRQAGDSLAQAFARLTADTVVNLEGLTATFSDFAQGANTYGVYSSKVIGFTNGGLQMVPGSSTHGSIVNGQVAANNGQTVQETLVRLGRGTSLVTKPYFSGTMQATAQGHIYNGLIIYYATGGTVEDASFLGIPGSGSAPPGETFPLNIYKSTDVVIRRVLIDGQGVSASGLGHNQGARPLVQDSVFKNMGYGAGVTQYLTDSPTYERCQFLNNKNYGVNCEKVTGTVTLRNCTFSGNPSADLCVDTDGASAIVNIYDPIWDGMNTGSKFRIKRHDTYNYPPPAVSPNGQNISDFHIFQGGVDVTATKLQIVT